MQMDSHCVRIRDSIAYTLFSYRPLVVLNGIFEQTDMDRTVELVVRRSAVRFGNLQTWTADKRTIEYRQHEGTLYSGKAVR